MSYSLFERELKGDYQARRPVAVIAVMDAPGFLTERNNLTYPYQGTMTRYAGGGDYLWGK